MPRAERATAHRRRSRSNLKEPGAASLPKQPAHHRAPVGHRLATCMHAGTPGYRSLQDRRCHRGIELQLVARPARAGCLPKLKRLQLGAGQGLDLTEFRGPLLPASQALRACCHSSWQKPRRFERTSYCGVSQRVRESRWGGLNPVADGRAVLAAQGLITGPSLARPNDVSLRRGRLFQLRTGRHRAEPSQSPFGARAPESR